MLKLKIRRLTADTRRAGAQVAEIQQSVVALKDEDLLDLADIFSGSRPTLLGELASAEMKRRNLSFEGPSKD